MAALSAEAYGAARALMGSILDDEGKPMGVMPTHLVVPPQLEAAGRTILNSDVISGSTNIYKGSAQLVVMPQLAAHATKWFLLDCSRAVRPLILQRVGQPEFVAVEDPSDSTVFMRGKYLYGTEARHQAGYGLWQFAYGSTGEGEGN